MVVMFLWCVQKVAGLKEQDLPSDPPTAAGSSSTLSESHMYTSCDSGTPIYTGIADLASVKKFVKSVVDWQSLGLELGLLYPTLKRIKKEQHGDINDCIMEMLVAWLQQQDNVREKGVPSWSVLRNALKEVGVATTEQTTSH